MKRRRRGSRSLFSSAPARPVRSEINVTPLVDVVLVLLIIFMVVTPLLSRGVELELPRTRHHARKTDTGQLLVVTVRADGTYVESERVTEDELVARVRAAPPAKRQGVHLRADRSLPYARVRRVVERIHEAGVAGIGLATAEEQE